MNSAPHRGVFILEYTISIYDFHNGLYLHLPYTLSQQGHVVTINGEAVTLYGSLLCMLGQ